MPGVTVGESSIIGANSVVTKDIPPYSLAVGIPAIIKNVLYETIDSVCIIVCIII